MVDIPLTGREKEDEDKLVSIIRDCYMGDDEEWTRADEYAACLSESERYGSFFRFSSVILSHMAAHYKDDENVIVGILHIMMNYDYNDIGLCHDILFEIAEDTDSVEIRSMIITLSENLENTDMIDILEMINTDDIAWLDSYKNDVLQYLNKIKEESKNMKSDNLMANETVKMTKENDPNSYLDSYPYVDSITNDKFTEKYTRVVSLLPPNKDNNASDLFAVVRKSDDYILTEVVFQDGPIKEHGVNGAMDEDLLLMIITRMEGWQTSEYACEENAKVLEYLYKAVDALRERTNKREARGVEGTSIV